MELTSVKDGGLCCCRRPLSAVWTSSIGSDWSAALWTSCCWRPLPSDTSILTSWKASGDMCVEMKYGPEVDPVPVKLCPPACWLNIKEDCPLWWLFGRLWSWLSGSSGCFWLVEVAVTLGFRNLAHSWPVTISSRRLNEPRPKSKSPDDLEQEHNTINIMTTVKLYQSVIVTVFLLQSSVSLSSWLIHQQCQQFGSI